MNQNHLNIINKLDEIGYDSRYKDTIALVFESNKGEWVKWTWSHYYKEVLNFARALIHLGIPAYSTINIVGNNSPYWLVAYLGKLLLD